MSPSSVDVVVVAYNSRETLRDCVAPLTERHNVIVVDNASPDDSVAVLVDLAVEVIRAPRNGGFAYGCNLGIAAGTAEFVLLLNPDARIDLEGIDALVARLENDARVGGTGPRLLENDGTLAWSQRRFPRLRSTFSQALFLQRVAPLAGWSDEVIRDPAVYDRAGTPDWLSGACLLLRREALEVIGPMDEGFFLYSEETDLFRRFADADWGAVYEPRATAHHEGGASAPRSTTKQHWARSRVRYARKHHGPVIGVLEAFGVALGGLTHAAFWIHRPQQARGHADAGRAALGALRSTLKTG